jgi:hypothetical protein
MRNSLPPSSGLKYFIYMRIAYIFFMFFGDRSRVSVVGIAIGYGLDDRGVGVRVLVEVKNFVLFTPALWPTQPPIQWVRCSFPGVKRQGREADYSPPTSVEVKKISIYTSTPIRLHAVVLY